MIQPFHVTYDALISLQPIRISLVPRPHLFRSLQRAEKVWSGDETKSESTAQNPAVLSFPAQENRQRAEKVWSGDETRSSKHCHSLIFNE